MCLQMTGNDHTEQTADPLELAEIKRRWNPSLNEGAEYQTVCEKSLPGKSNPTRLSVRSMKVLLALFCGFFVNLIKKSLTTRFENRRTYQRIRGKYTPTSKTVEFPSQTVEYES